MRWWRETAGWILLIAVLWGTDLTVRLAEREQAGIGKDTFRLVTEQVTSALAVLVMVLFVVRWVRLFPLRRDAWAAAVVGHTAGSILFAFGHQVLMIALRIPLFAAKGLDYVWREPFVANLIIEYQKDIKVYFGIVAILTAYHWIRQQRRTAGTEPDDRILVQTGRGVSVVRVEEIDCLEAARNYVTVHARGEQYLLRDTLQRLEKTLSPDRLVRVHRSFLVNVGKVREVRQEDGRHYLKLENDMQIPVSRTHRDALMARLTGDDAAEPGLHR